MVGEARSSARLEAFSDGVIAVIITIMVLELKVPQAAGMAGMRSLVPILLVYLLSFGFTAIYWVNHHHLLDRVKMVDERLLYANAVFLFLLSLLPFFTNYLLEKGINAFSVSLYTTSMAAVGLGFLLVRLAVLRIIRLSGTIRKDDLAALRKHIASFGLYVVAFPTAHFYPVVALGLIAAVTLAWILPGLGSRVPGREGA